MYRLLSKILIMSAKAVSFPGFYIFFIFLNSTYAQQYNFRSYSVADGLPQSQVFALCEDKKGYLWIGTRGGGISRFDGIHFQTFTESDGLVNNYIKAIIEDNSGNIWIGTDGGLSRFNGKSFTNYTSKNGLPDNIINTLLKDISGNIWIGTDKGGLLKFDGKEFKVFTANDGLPQNRITCLFEDKNNGTLWIGTEKGVSKYDGKNFQNFNTKSGLTSNILRAITKDSKGNLWFATYSDGVSKFDGKTFRNFTKKDGLVSNIVLSITEDKKGNIWFGTGLSGISIFDGEKFNSITETEGLCNNIVSSLLKDSQGNIWIGTSGGGLCRYSDSRFIHFTQSGHKLGNLVYAIEEDNAGNIWLASSAGGVSRYSDTGFTRFGKADGLTNHKIRTIFRDSINNLWFGTLGFGLFKYDGKTFTHYDRNDGISGNFINSITTDKKGNLWLATAGGGICYLPFTPELKSGKKKGRFKRFKADIGSDRVYSITSDNNDNLWLGTVGAGVVKIANASDSLPVISVFPLKKENDGGLTVRTVLKDKTGNIWIGSAGTGVYCYDGKKFHTFDKKNGLSSDNIYSLVFDSENNLWIGTERGIDKLSFDQNFRISGIKNYSKSEGFSGIETIQNAAFLDSKNRLWFGTVNGTTVYNSAEDKLNLHQPKIHISAVKLFFDKIEDTTLTKTDSHWPFLPKDLTLNHNQNHVSFEFIGINLRNPEMVQYKWFLEGFDKDWSPPTFRTEATYSNLPPCNYKFQVLAANEDGIWSSVPATFSFKITPPFWQKWWFRGAMLLLAGIVIYSAFALRLRQIKRKNEAERNKLALEKNVIELEQQALRLQMNPHFIFNALNSIQGFITRNDTAEAKRYLAKFSKLMRQTLENSRESFIPLAEEIEMLENYIALEKLSHKDRFEFEIELDDDIDPEAISIPPMLIQPFIENAILHGVLPLNDRKGEINISFKLLNDKLLICIIKDNGVGINQSLKLKSKLSNSHKSTAYKVTEERLQLISLGSIVVKDLTEIYESEYKEEGTQVELQIPYVIV